MMSKSVSLRFKRVGRIWCTHLCQRKIPSVEVSSAADLKDVIVGIEGALVILWARRCRRAGRNNGRGSESKSRHLKKRGCHFEYG